MLANLECGRHSCLSFYLVRDVAIHSNHHRHWRKASWRAAVCVHSLSTKAPTSPYFPGATSDTFRLERMSRKRYVR
ncbi:hypothetical protein E2C01_052831 [Portunus trituberculatus]|uniref:Uncharacterized protein n=1 Tax=Portunus trituberculatus TaxID=210409 RepID=A0A5B7GFL8_PORTR|nr:hypothetical protein [Portunus trituberculatus]